MTEQNEVIVDRRDLFDFFRAAHREGQSVGQLEGADSWHQATDYADSQIKGWKTLRSNTIWISVDERLPEVGIVVMVYSPPTKHDWPDDIRINFDCIDPDADEPTSWRGHNEHYEHFCCVAKPEGTIGPSEKAPYTHWSPIPAPPIKDSSND